MRSLIFCLIMIPTLAFAQSFERDETSDEILTFETGVICAPPADGESAAPNTVAGTTHLISEPPPFVSKGNRVPAVLGVGFGATALATAAAGIPDVTIFVRHPPMGQDRITEQSFGTRIDGTDPSIMFYQFDFDYELLVGAWQIEARQGGRVLYRKSFQVVPPTEIPELASICGFEELLS